MKPLYAILILMTALLAWAQDDPPWSPTFEAAMEMGWPGENTALEPIAPDPAKMPTMSDAILSGPLMPPPPPLPDAEPMNYTVVTGYVYEVAYETNSANGVVRQIDSVSITNKVNVPVYPKVLWIQPQTKASLTNEWKDYGVPIMVKLGHEPVGFYTVEMKIE